MELIFSPRNPEELKCHHKGQQRVTIRGVRESPQRASTSNIIRFQKVNVNHVMTGFLRNYSKRWQLLNVLSENQELQVYWR